MEADRSVEEYPLALTAELAEDELGWIARIAIRSPLHDPYATAVVPGFHPTREAALAAAAHSIAALLE